jgi:predicted polyphosphate/ATP-dependent NAD kinase
MTYLIALGGDSVPNFAIASVSKRKQLPVTGGNPPNIVFGVAFSPDGTLCAVVHNAAPYLTVYNVSDWTKVPSPFAVLPVNNILRAVAFLAPPARIIRGNVRDIDGDLVSRRVRVYDRTDGALCGSTTSDPITGEYEVLLYEGDVEYDVQFMAADGENLNDLIYARTQSGAA